MAVALAVMTLSPLLTRAVMLSDVPLPAPRITPPSAYLGVFLPLTSRAEACATAPVTMPTISAINVGSVSGAATPDAAAAAVAPCMALAMDTAVEMSICK